MINYYYHYYDESITELVDRFCVKSLVYDLNTNINSQNDIFLIHLILRINQDKAIYRKSELEECIWKMFSERCKEYADSTSNDKIDNYQSGFYLLFDYCWKQKFSQHADGKDAKPIYLIVYSKAPLKWKLIDSNISLALYFILFAVLCFFIDKWIIEDCSYKWDFESIETHPIAIAICILFMVFTFFASTRDSENATIYGPALCCLLLILSALILALFEPDSMLFNSEYQRFELSESAITHLEIQFIKRNIYLGLACLLLIPMLRLNYTRLKEQLIL